ncbi:unnamed protein product [Spodoptera exigua]|nr:unnamed protein product [Spodoptera exigua]
MSEEHDLDFPMNDEKHDEENEEKVAGDEDAVVDTEPTNENAGECQITVDTEKPSANTSKEDSAIDAIDKETLSSEVDEKKDLYGANEKSTLRWTAEGNEFKIAWNLPPGTATNDDYIALCCTGKRFVIGVTIR